MRDREVVQGKMGGLGGGGGRKKTHVFSTQVWGREQILVYKI